MMMTDASRWLGEGGEFDSPRSDKYSASPKEKIVETHIMAWAIDTCKCATLSATLQPRGSTRM